MTVPLKVARSSHHESVMPIRAVFVLDKAPCVEADIGLEVGFHRHTAHRAFRGGPAVRAALLARGSMAVPGPVIWWRAVHRRHHKLSDSEGDPLSLSSWRCSSSVVLLGKHAENPLGAHWTATSISTGIGTTPRAELPRLDALQLPGNHPAVERRRP